MKKLLIYLLFIFISINSNAQFYSINIGYPLSSRPLIDASDLNPTTFNKLKFGVSKSYLVKKNKWYNLDGQFNLSFVSYGNKSLGYAGFSDTLVELVEKSSTIQISHHFKHNIFNNISLFISYYYIIPVSNSFEYNNFNNQSIMSDSYILRSFTGSSFGISYLTDNLINFELSFSPTSYSGLRNRNYSINELYLTLGYVIK